MEKTKVQYEAVIGLEIHAQLLTKSKAFSNDANEYGNNPNENISVISLGHPGTLPRHNKTAVEQAIKVGLACQSEIRKVNQYARKNYFYQDLPKGYQVTQDKTPICNGGKVEITQENGETMDVGLTRIHMEEDSGKSIHNLDMNNTLIDYNRAGTPLIEIVTEPVIKTGEQASLFVAEVRKLLRYLEVCDGNMEEGSLRCDANISVRPVGQKAFGTKVEVKNMNSITNVRKAIEFEIIRQTQMCEKGEEILSETRSFDALRNLTFTMRAKELVNDYRYFPEPDLPPLILTDERISILKAEMPALPKELYAQLNNEHKLPAYDSGVITETKEVAHFYLAITEHTQNYKAAANWVMGAVKNYLNKNAVDMSQFPLQPKHIADLILLIDQGKVSYSIAEQKIFPHMIEHPNQSAENIAEELNVIQSADEDFLEELIQKALGAFPDKVEEYKNGKKGLLGLFMGEVMKLSGGKADPKATSRRLKEILDA